MGKKELINMLDKTTEIEKHLLPVDDGFLSGIKTINRNVDFQIWKAELKRELLQMKEEPLVLEILQLLDNGFKDGWSDEKDFINLKSRLSVLSTHLDEYFGEELKVKTELKKLKKETIIHTAFDDYKIIQQEGSGGNGRVFSAETTDGEKVAIKFVERTTSSEKLKRFKNEINFCEQHKHKNIIPILDRGYVLLDDKDFVFYVMPLYKETLRKKIKEGIPQEKMIDIFVGILEGLKFAHDHNAIHRDIKPDNILFSENSFKPVICDFGIAHFAEEELLTAVETKPGDRMANFYYAAPEQYVRGGKVYPQTDLYSAALILNEMFTGEIPQAAGYKKIKDVAEEYAFLDDVFEQLYIQDPEKRLYPEDRILSEMKLLAEKYQNEQEKKKLQSKIDDTIIPEEFEVKIISKSYEDGLLVFEFNRSLPHEWTSILVHGSYNCSYRMGYGHEKLELIGSTKIGMPLRGSESEETLKTIVSNVQGWVSEVNLQYNQELKRRARIEQQRKEDARKAEIKRLEQVDTISSILAKL